MVLLFISPVHCTFCKLVVTILFFLLENDIHPHHHQCTENMIITQLTSQENLFFFKYVGLFYQQIYISRPFFPGHHSGRITINVKGYTNLRSLICVTHIIYHL